jgi:hypothetical protein
MSGGKQQPPVAQLKAQPVVNGSIEVGVRIRWNGEVAIVTDVDKSLLYLCVYTSGRRVAENAEPLTRFGVLDLDNEDAAKQLELLEGV